MRALLCKLPGAKLSLTQAKSATERADAAKQFVAAKADTFTWPVVCDGMENQFLTTFGAWPTRYYIVQDGVLKFKIQLSTEPGRFDIRELRAWLEANCTE